MKMTESNGGKNCGRGASGEYGCYQYMPDHWAKSSKKYIGYVAPQTRINEEYVAVHEFQQMLNTGLNGSSIARTWNQGNASACKSGTNRFGVYYNSCVHEKVFLAYYRSS